MSLLVAVLLAVISAGFLWLHKQEAEKTPAFLPGVYTSAAQNEFCRIDDTLVIRRTRMGEDSYNVRRATCFVRIRDGKKAPPEYQEQHWEAQYQMAKYRLVSNNEADTVLYYPEKNRISKAGFYYEKIE